MNRKVLPHVLWAMSLFILSACAPATATLVVAAETSTPAFGPLSPALAEVLSEWHVNMPVKMAFTSDSVWIPSHRDPSVITRIDPVANQTTATIEGIGFQAGQAIAVGDSIWVTGYGLTKIDPKTNAIPSMIQKTEHYAYLVGGFQTLWATNGSDGLDRIDPGTSKIVASIKLGANRVDCNNDVFVISTAVWVDHCDGAELIEIDPATNSIISRTPYEKMVHEAKSTTNLPQGKGSDFIWKVVSPGGLLRIDPNTGTGVTFLPMNPEQLGDGFFTVTDDAVWVNGYGQIEKVNVATNQIEATYQLHDKGGSHVGIGFGSVWISYEDTGLVQRLDIAP